MKNVRKTNRRKLGKMSTKKLGGITMRKTRRLGRSVNELARKRNGMIANASNKPISKPKSSASEACSGLNSEGRLSVPLPMKVVIGKIYSDQCIHCQNMAGAWEEMKRDLPDNYTVWDIESKDEESKKKDFQQQHGVQLQSSGYPTIFMIVQGKQMDYNGDRDKDHLLQWARGKVG
jgi:hypothetical protein